MTDAISDTQSFQNRNFNENHLALLSDREVLDYVARLLATRDQSVAKPNDADSASELVYNLETAQPRIDDLRKTVYSNFSNHHLAFC